MSHLEDGKHHAAEGSVIRELCHVKDIKAPLVQVVQLLKSQTDNINTLLRNSHEFVIRDNSTNKGA